MDHWRSDKGCLVSLQVSGLANLVSAGFHEVVCTGETLTVSLKDKLEILLIRLGDAAETRSIFRSTLDTYLFYLCTFHPWGNRMF